MSTMEVDDASDKEEAAKPAVENDISAEGNIVICKADLATHIHNVSIKDIIPQLHRCLVQKVSA